MRRAVLSAAAWLLATALAVAAAPGPLERLPAGAQFVGFLDLSAWRASSALSGVDARPLLGVLGDGRFKALERAGRFERIGFGGWPRGESLDLALIVEGAWDARLLDRAMAESGAVQVAVAGRPAWRLPRTEQGNDFVLSQLGDGLLSISDWELAEAVGAGAGALTPGLAAEVAALPEGLAAFLLVEDPLAAGSVSGVDTRAAAGLLQGLKSLGLWARAGDEVLLGASASTVSAGSATQMSGMLQGLAFAFSGQAAAPWSELLRGLRFETAGERLQVSLPISPKQLQSLAEGWQLSPAPPAQDR